MNSVFILGFVSLCVHASVRACGRVRACVCACVRVCEFV